MSTEETSAWPMWSMSRGVLKVVAALIALCAIAGFVLGVQSAPEKSRLPGEAPAAGSGAALDAPEATPLVDETPPPPPPEKKKEDEEEVKKDEVDPSAAAPLVTPPPAANSPAAKAPEDKVGDLLDGVTPPPQDDPPH